MKEHDLQNVRALTRAFVRELDYLKDANFQFDIGHFHRHLLVEIGLYPEAGALDLSKILGADKGNISRGIKKLVQGNYLSEKINKVDRRKRDLFLTKKGRDVVDAVNKYSNEKLKAALNKLNKKQRGEMISGVELFVITLQQHREAK